MFTDIIAACFAYVAYSLVAGCLRDIKSRETENTLKP